MIMETCTDKNTRIISLPSDNLKTSIQEFVFKMLQRVHGCRVSTLAAFKLCLFKVKNCSLLDMHDHIQLAIYTSRL
ncbi:unnamed protein product [Schistosoma mansoni]|uniref:Smp_204800 n=1 Tax=Schistosoma mansoni TaxID=6183 RepID=UPI00022C81B4|nr:unnamed protein product [Schistosoma mansoni]|eukprot:XP_018646695.1 unnamed protein product [Schistosoma mansoni]